MTASVVRDTLEGYEGRDTKAYEGVAGKDSGEEVFLGNVRRVR